MPRHPKPINLNPEPYPYTLIIAQFSVSLQYQ